MDSPQATIPAPAELRTDRLRLRRITHADVPAVVAISVDPRANEYRPGGAPTTEDAESRAREFMADWRRNGIGYWAVEYQDRVVGICGVKPLVLGGRDCWNLYYRFSPSVWGEGVASEATREAIRVARLQAPGRPVVARTRPANAAAIQLAVAVGLSRHPQLDADGLIAYLV